MRRVFKALGVVTATIDLGIAGKVALWLIKSYACGFRVFETKAICIAFL